MWFNIACVGVGVFYPLSEPRTGPTATLVSTMESVTGNHHLFAVVCTAVEDTIGGFDAMRVRRAIQPQPVSAIGIPPLKNNQGG